MKSKFSKGRLEISFTDKQDVFERLAELPPDNSYWQNRWMFTKPVFMNESIQASDFSLFSLWIDKQPKTLVKYIYAAPLHISEG